MKGIFPQPQMWISGHQKKGVQTGKGKRGRPRSAQKKKSRRRKTCREKANGTDKTEGQMDQKRLGGGAKENRNFQNGREKREGGGKTNTGELTRLHETPKEPPGSEAADRAIIIEGDRGQKEKPGTVELLSGEGRGQTKKNRNLNRPDVQVKPSLRAESRKGNSGRILLK